jgi:hypothetical protein
MACLAAAFIGGAALVGWQPGCGSSSESEGVLPSPTTTVGGGGAGAGGISGGGTGGGLLVIDASSTLEILPANPVVQVNIVDGVVSTAPLTLQAIATGDTPVAASWSFDRPELGALDGSGVFTASGNLPGKGIVTAQYAGAYATTTISVAIHATQNGGPAGAGGGGVGGEGPGGAVDQATQTLLLGSAQAPLDSSELGWLYPYDLTVWPRGLLPPLLQWQTTHSVSAVYIRLTQQDYEFQGFYSGSNLVRHPLDLAAWTRATSGNEGDPLKIELRVLDGSSVFGPIAETWKVAPGTLKGTVYYTEYSNFNPRFGAEMAIKPGATAPTYATGDTACRACHEVSADGSTLFSGDETYVSSASYDLTQSGQLIATYAGNAPDGTSNINKFYWSAPYPDGTFVMANSRHAIGPPGNDNYLGDSQLFSRTDGNAISTTGWSTSVTSAVTPAFSPDGKRLVFNFWEGTTTNGVSPGAGHNLAVMDFACGAPPGSTTCSMLPYMFSNLRQLFSDAERYPGWPAFLPDASGLVFSLTPHEYMCTGTGCGANVKPPAELWWVDVPANPQTPAQAVRLDALLGISNGQSYLPTNANHPDDTALSYKPTVVPIAIGGYSWVMFMSRRMYGNVATGDPFARADNVEPCLAKLWVAAIDLNPTPGTDPSHPAFYLPAQDFMHANIHGFWVADPCKPNGEPCLSGDDCCGGYCRQSGDAGLACGDQPMGCSQEYEKCTTGSDCCSAGINLICVNGRCAFPPPN